MAYAPDLSPSRTQDAPSREACQGETLGAPVPAPVTTGMATSWYTSVPPFWHVYLVAKCSSLEGLRRAAETTASPQAAEAALPGQ